jgi:glycosyltransferase involved in cell wall biosynthesis
LVANFVNAAKNITGVLDAFRQVIKKYPGYKLILAGNGPDFEMVKLYAEGLSFPDGVVSFTGFVGQTQLDELYRNALCYILNSNFETFSVSAAEALLYGIPVISTRCYGPEDYINDRNGILIEKNNTHQLVLAIQRVIENPNLFNREDIRSDAHKHFNVSVAEKFDEVYNSVFLTDK